MVRISPTSSFSSITIGQSNSYSSSGGNSPKNSAFAASTSVRFKVLLVVAVAVVVVVLGTTSTGNSASLLQAAERISNHLTDVADAPVFASSSSSALLRSNNKRSKYSFYRPAGQIDDDDDQCRFYLAESAIPKGGLGMFTTVPLKKGQEAQSMPDICIYCVNTPEERTPFYTHSWSRGTFNGRFEGKHPRAACEGFATQLNTMPDHVKTSRLIPMQTKTNAGLERWEHAGAGAITHYYGVTSEAVRDVPAGSELTINYGGKSNVGHYCFFFWRSFQEAFPSHIRWTLS